MSKQSNRYKRLFGQRLSLVALFLLIIMVTAPTAVQALEQDNCSPCHGKETADLAQSVHASLSCTSCHSDIKSYPHASGSHPDKKKEVATCSQCHTGPVTLSYAESFHGKAVNLGSQKAAGCVDCHGHHDILSPDNPSSRVAKNNVPTTCAVCHHNASPGFSQGTEHFELKAAGPGAPMYHTSQFFVWLTIITVTLLIIHIEMQLYHNLRRILAERKRR